MCFGGTGFKSGDLPVRRVLCVSSVPPGFYRFLPYPQQFITLCHLATHSSAKRQICSCNCFCFFSLLTLRTLAICTLTALSCQSQSRKPRSECRTLTSTACFNFNVIRPCWCTEYTKTQHSRHTQHDFSILMATCFGSSLSSHQAFM